MNYKSWNTENGTILQIDAIDLLKSLQDESVDLCIFDPAYESLEKWRATGTTTRLKHSKGSSNDWFTIFPNNRYPELFGQLYRVMKKGTFVLMFCDEETRDVVLYGQSAQSNASVVAPCGVRLTSEFKYWKAMIWDKVYPGMGYHFPVQHEFILMFEKVERKGKHRKLNTNRPGDILPAKRLKGKGYYPTEKPASLIWKLITECSNPGDTVLDMFAGSGVVGQVCEMTGRKYVLGDINVKEIVKRLVEHAA